MIQVLKCVSFDSRDSVVAEVHVHVSVSARGVVKCRYSGEPNTGAVDVLVVTAIIGAGAW